MSREATVSGIVTKFYWANPHSYIYLDVDVYGEIQHWAIELEALNALRHQGWTKETLKPGDKISCSGARAKDPSSYTMKCFTVELPDGRIMHS